MSRELSAAAREFARAHIRSPLELDVLLALEDDGSRWWSADALAAALRVPLSSLASILDALAVASLLDVKVAGDVLYRFAPLNDVRHLLREIELARRLDAAAANRPSEEGV